MPFAIQYNSKLLITIVVKSRNKNIGPLWIQRNVNQKINSFLILSVAISKTRHLKDATDVQNNPVRIIKNIAAPTSTTTKGFNNFQK